MQPAEQIVVADSHIIQTAHLTARHLLVHEVTQLPPPTSPHSPHAQVAAEIYSRLLQGAAVPPREREVAQRKLAECERLLRAEAS